MIDALRLGTARAARPNGVASSAWIERASVGVLVRRRTRHRLRSDNEGQRAALALAQGDHDAALAGLMLCKATVNPIFCLVGRADVAAEVRAVDFNFAVELQALRLGSQRFADFVRENEGRLVLAVQIAASCKALMPFAAFAKMHDRPPADR